MLAGAPVSLPFSAPFNNLKWIAETRMIIYSLLVIVLMLARPQGMFSWTKRTATKPGS
jgi:ABC-type branched-subunit amino acid transport system permease subunit